MCACVFKLHAVLQHVLASSISFVLWHEAISLWWAITCFALFQTLKLRNVAHSVTMSYNHSKSQEVFGLSTIWCRWHPCMPQGHKTVLGRHYFCRASIDISNKKKEKTSQEQNVVNVKVIELKPTVLGTFWKRHHLYWCFNESREFLQLLVWPVLNWFSKLSLNFLKWNLKQKKLNVKLSANRKNPLNSKCSSMKCSILINGGTGF